MLGSDEVFDTNEELLFRNLMLLETAALTTRELEAAGIPSLVYKGCALFDFIVPLHARTASDVDLLLPRGTQRQARSVLAEVGFDVAPTATRARAAHPAGAVVAPNGCAVDLHEELAQKGRFCPPRAVFSRGTRVPQGRAAFVRMHLDDLCLAGAANLVKDEFTASKGRLEEFSLTLDVAMRDSDLKPPAFARSLWALAREWRLERGLWATIRWAIAQRVRSAGALVEMENAASTPRVWRRALEAVFDFSAPSPLGHVRSRRGRQAIALPLLTDRPLRLWRPVLLFANARIGDRVWRPLQGAR